MATASDDPHSSDSDARLIEAALRQELGEAGTETLSRTSTGTAERRAGAAIPQTIGRYRITRVIASGGMGTVYEAVQDKPHRTVALKLIKQGIASPSALRRFEFESQVLGRLRHPGIAQVYDAGTYCDESGTMPYFAMEFIPNAKTLTRYAQDKMLGTRDRMRLFAEVCDAVHHGHQKGVIHRDLKPSNILVDANGHPKIIDFGVARGTDSDMAVTTLQTDVGQLIGTLQYMSPEQCEADPHNIDTRCDVYALGVVFFELLTDRLPYNLARKAIHEATRMIREEPPAKLSTFNRRLRGDVETIALKALEKDRDRRYQAATDFAQDIKRYLGNEPISARPASVLYHVRVFSRRNRSLVGAVVVVFAVLLGTTIFSTWLSIKAERARRNLVNPDNLTRGQSGLLGSENTEPCDLRDGGGLTWRAYPTHKNDRSAHSAPRFSRKARTIRKAARAQAARNGSFGVRRSIGGGRFAPLPTRGGSNCTTLPGQ